MSNLFKIEELYASHYTPLYRFIRNKVRNESIAEDLVQMTFVQVLLHKDSFLGDSKPSTWLYGIAINIVFTYFRRQKNGKVDFTEDDTFVDIADYNPGPEEILCFKQLLENIQKASERISKRQLEILEMFMEAMTYEEIAIELGVPIGTVRSRLNKARTSMRKGMRKYGQFK